MIIQSLGHKMSHKFHLKKTTWLRTGTKAIFGLALWFTWPAAAQTDTVYKVTCDGSAADTNALRSQRAENGITIDGTCLVTSNLRLSGPIYFQSRGVLKPAGGVTITVDGPVSGVPTQHFDLSAGGKIRGSLQAPYIPVQWFDSGANASARRLALQSAIDLATSDLSRRNISISLCGAGQNGVFDIGEHGVRASGNDMPFIDGCQPHGQVSPDSTNLKMSPSAREPAITFAGNTSICGCGVRGIYFDGNANTVAVTLNNVVGSSNNIGFSPNIGLALHFLNTDSKYTEANRSVLSGGLSSTGLLARFSNNGGTGSFAGNSFEPGTQVSTAAKRSLPLIQVDRGAFWYNGILNINVHNNGTAPLYIINNQQDPPLSITGGVVQLEGSNSATIGFANPSANRVYFGGTVTSHAIRNGDFSAVTFCRTFYYDTSIMCRGGLAQQLQSAGAGNAVIPIPNLLGVSDGKYNVSISSGDGSYHYVGQVSTFIDSGSSGFLSVDAGGLVADRNGYGVPVFAIAGSQLTVRNPNWPARLRIEVNYSEHSN